MPFETARCVAAESIVIEMAQNTSFSVVLSERQTQLNIPPPLVVLAGMAHLVEQPPQKCFAALQDKYYNALDKEDATHRQFEWSPTLMPSRPEDQAELEMRIQQRVVQLEQQSSIQAEALMQEANEHDAMLKRQASKKKKKKSKRMVPATASDRDNSTVKSDESEDEARLDSLVLKSDSPEVNENAMAFVNVAIASSFQTFVDQDVRDEEWTVVRRRMDVSSPRNDNNEESVAPNESLDNNKRTVALEESERRDKEQDKTVSDLSKPPTNFPLPAPSESATRMPTIEADDKTIKGNHHSTAESQVLATAAARIKELETQLTTAQNLLETERQQHRKALQREQEAAQDRMQALQLRLYIAETRLKTFEDALAQHNQNVANNVAKPLSPPGRRRSKSPLYSKILRNDG